MSDKLTVVKSHFDGVSWLASSSLGNLLEYSTSSPLTCKPTYCCNKNSHGIILNVAFNKDLPTFSDITLKVTFAPPLLFKSLTNSICPSSLLPRFNGVPSFLVLST